MIFLVWNNQQDAEDSIDAIGAVYGCPYEADNGYRMDCWDNVVSSRNEDQWGFFKPEARLGKQVNDLMAGVTPGFIEHAEKPIEFYPEELDGKQGRLIGDLT